MTDGRVDERLYVVGIGASAGGLAAIQRFFEGVTDLPKAAIVIVQHLSPDFKSMMDEILSRHTDMPVQVLSDGMKLEEGCVYLNVPRQDLTVKEGHFVTTPVEDERGLRHPIDTFFESLAIEYGDHAVGVILSGTGTDGSRGLPLIAKAGGMTVVQTPDDTSFDGMPRAALATTPMSRNVTASNIGELLYAHLTLDEGLAHALVSSHGIWHILRLLQNQYNVDFDAYKRGTISRRIMRRIELAGLNETSEYYNLLRDDDDELEALFEDLLIGVTSFFRDEEAFKTLAEKALDGSAFQSGSVRAWVAGCASGEEAYSLAIMLDEMVRERPELQQFFLFATDIHPRSLRKASLGIYPAKALEAVSPERMARYFVEVEGGYQVHRSLRQRIVFAPHNLLVDAPFTRMDIVSCRNLLIYLDNDAQQQVFKTFHHALNRHGVLFLGPSESLGDMREEFGELDTRWKVFHKLRDVRLPISRSWSADPLNIKPVLNTVLSEPPRSVPGERNIVVAYDSLLDRLGITGFLLNESRELLHTFGEASRFMKPPVGRVSMVVSDFLQLDLRAVVTSALSRARERGHVRVEGVTIERSEHPIDIDVRRLKRFGHVQYLVTLEEDVDAAEREPDVVLRSNAWQDEHAEHLGEMEREIERLRQNLQIVTEQAEASNEELQATNEELLAANEELQSTNEELQSMNEELHTINAEYQFKIDELNELNTDLDHLLTSSESATLFLDENLQVRRMTTKISDLFNLLPQDLGRPFEHITSRLEWPTMMQDIQHVFRTGAFWESELQHHDGRWFLCRVRPYRIRPDELNGVNLSLVDITTKQAMLEQLATSEHRLRVIMEEVNDGYWDWKLEPDGSPTDQEYLSPSFKAMFGFADHELENSPSSWEGLINTDDYKLAFANFTKHLETDGAHPYDQLVRYTHRDGSPMWVICRGTALKNPNGTWDRMVGTHQDVTKLKQVEEELRRSNADLDQFTAVVSHDLKEPLRMVASFSKLLVEKYEHEDYPDAKMYSEFIEEGVMRMNGLIQDLLEFSRLTARDSTREELNLLSALASARDNLLAQLDKADAELTWDTLPDVHAVPVQMKQVFQNLMSNAVKFRHPERELTIHIGCIEEPGRWVISVRDNGVGIDPNSHDRIFEMFQRGQATRETPGNGVGLSTVKKIVEQHGGVISVDSTVGEGSTFVFTLPKQGGRS